MEKIKIKKKADHWIETSFDEEGGLSSGSESDMKSILKT